MRPSSLLAALLLSAPAPAQPIDRPTPGRIRVMLETSAGRILLSLDARRAPVTTANFLTYVDDGRFDDTSFYRTARKRADPKAGFIQGGIRTDARRILPPFKHEPTSATGIRHTDATISMAHAVVGSAGGNFFITVGPAPAMDATATSPGYAAFGKVIGGMATVRRILAQPSGGGFDQMKGQIILKPIRILRARRLDGTPKPTGKPKVWLLMRR